MAEGPRILFVASECVPFVKTGGLGDVVGALPKALAGRGADVRVVLPLYRGVPWDDLEVLEGVLEVPGGSGVERAGIRLGELPGSHVPVYFLEHLRYFDRDGIYGEPESYADNLARFAFLSRGSLRLCRALGWIPEVLHAHDWPAALVPVCAGTVEHATFGATPTLFTVHNVAHQGVFAREEFPATGLPPGSWDPDRFEHDGALNLMKGALRSSTLLTTVSPTYAREIQSPALGHGLHQAFRDRAGDLYGILNGIDPLVWDPARDPHIAATYNASDLSGKAVCKAALQEELGLPVRADVPLFGVIARLDPQKGLDVLAEALPDLTELDLQMALLGTGRPALEHAFAGAAAARPDRMAARIGFDVPLAHRIEAGADFFLMPSRFEPCGLNQLYSLRYGTLPVVRATGGLADTVESYHEATGRGTGFSFHDLHAQSLFDAVGWATATWYERPAHVRAMRREAMTRDFTWDHSATRYLELYALALQRRPG